MPTQSELPALTPARRRQGTAPLVPAEAPAQQREPEQLEAFLRRWGRLVRDLEKAGLSEGEAMAEAPRLLAGDVWSG